MRAFCNMLLVLAMCLICFGRSAVGQDAKPDVWKGAFEDTKGNLKVESAARPTTLASTQDLRSLALSDEATATTQLRDWLQARGFDCEISGDYVLYRTQNVLTNILPILTDNGIDRLLVNVYYNPKDEFKGSDELVDLATKLTVAQNVFRVFVDGDGDLAASTQMTFYEEFSSREFDTFMELTASAIKSHILVDESLRYLK